MTRRTYHITPLLADKEHRQRETHHHPELPQLEDIREITPEPPRRLPYSIVRTTNE